MTELASAIAAKILEKLGSLASEELSLVLNIKSELDELKGTMTTITDVLIDAEERQAGDRRLSNWLRELKDIFYQAEDVLDEVECEVLRKQVTRTYGSPSREVRHFFSCYSGLTVRSQLGHKIKDIRGKLRKIADRKDMFNLIPRIEARQVMHQMREMTHSYISHSDVIGRNDDKEKIIGLLRQPDANRNVNVIPIVGIGGMGKTTLAKWVYNDNCVVEQFGLRMWVCVSQVFKVNSLIGEILKSASGTIYEGLSVDSWQSNLRNYLKNKKFLLVLDDVWNEDRSKWKELKGILNGGLEGSTIIVTTRSRLVASIVENGPIHILKGLSPKDCFDLFVKHAFNEGEDQQYPNLVEIGREIVGKCKGVPLAIRTLGSLLCSKFEDDMWISVRDNEIWKLPQNEDDILPVLKLSYDHMSYHLKRCFAFCSLFPKDHWFHSHELIAFWMAHGLLTKMQYNQNQELEDVGNMYINELCSIYFFQDVEKELSLYRFKMHDLIHDLALMVAEEECSVVDLHTQNIAGTVRHLSFSLDGLQVPTYLYTLSSGVRTTLFPTKQEVPTLVEACILRLKYLRVLDLSYSSFEVLSTSIGTLKHLRYLSLAGNSRIKKLPDSICKLYNLQTLLLHGCLKLERLPKDTRKMISLRYLTVTTYTCLFENGVFCLNSLQILCISLCPMLEVLFQGIDKSLTNLRTLVVSRCNRLTSLTHDIKHLTSLETLVIEHCRELSLMGGEDNQNLKFSLRKLKILELPKFDVLPQWLQGSADTLQFLSIEDCENFMALPDWLPSMKSLQTLEIINCSKLSSLPEGMDHLTSLRELTIIDCAQLIKKCKGKDWSKIPKVRLH